MLKGENVKPNKSYMKSTLKEYYAVLENKLKLKI